KVALPQAVLQKPGRLTEHERELVQRHPEIGCTMLERWECVRQLLPAVRHHHEWYDGTGYPDGLAGDQIPMSARILAVADSYDAMTSSRPYREPLSIDEARAEVAGQAGTQFDPTVVEAFLDVVA